MTVQPDNPHATTSQPPPAFDAVWRRCAHAGESFRWPDGAAFHYRAADVRVSVVEPPRASRKHHPARALPGIVPHVERLEGAYREGRFRDHVYARPLDPPIGENDW